jgi:sensor c-di-GMP phosphodiesterase-like protein
MKISGQVFDSSGEPLASANVTLVSGANAGKFGAVTNLDGEFSLDSEIIQPESKFKVSYLGFVSQEWTALALQDKKITLLDGVEQLKEVVITAKKKPTAVVSNTDTPIASHFKKYKTVYVGGATLAGILLIASSIKKFR